MDLAPPKKKEEKRVVKESRPSTNGPLPPKMTARPPLPPKKLHPGYVPGGNEKGMEHCVRNAEYVTYDVQISVKQTNIAMQ